MATLMALGFGAMGDLSIRHLSLLALAVTVIWVGFAWYAGRRFDAVSAEETEPFPRVKPAAGVGAAAPTAAGGT